MTTRKTTQKNPTIDINIKGEKKSTNQPSIKIIGAGNKENRVVTRGKEKSERDKVGREKCRPFFFGLCRPLLLQHAANE